MEIFNVYTDGGARGNPGPAAVGVVIIDSKGTILCELKRTIGITTNNVAEYTALLDALDWIASNLRTIHSPGFVFHLDSELVVKQLSGEYQVKQPHLQTLRTLVHSKLRSLHGIYTVQHVLRENNKLADSLVNQALDLDKSVH